MVTSRVPKPKQISKFEQRGEYGRLLMFPHIDDDIVRDCAAVPPLNE